MRSIQPGQKPFDASPVAGSEVAIPTEQNPNEVSMRQARLALHRTGFLSSINTMLAQPGNEEALIEWEYATVVQKNSPLLSTLASQLGLTRVQIDELFALAKTL